MSRVVNTNSPGKRRNHHMRSCAELLRHLSQKQNVDDETRDMIAAMVFALAEIEKSIDDATDAWEKRDYWIKAEQFRERWAWVTRTQMALTMILHEEDWNNLPTQIVSVLPHFSEITVNKFTRSSDLWDGRYEAFKQMAE